MSRLDWLLARPVAHRGLHDAAAGVIENTASAFAAAIAAGYAIEVDVQVTADGDAVVHHDDTLGRLTEGEGRLAGMTAAELKRVPFKATADRMMTLSELCEQVAGCGTLLIELKSHGDGDTRLSARVAEVLGQYRGAAAVMSFDPLEVAAVRQLDPSITRGIVAERRHRSVADIRNAIAAGPGFIAYAVADLPSPGTLLGRYLLRLPILTWTVRTPEDRRRALRWADQMIFEGFRP